MTVKSKGLTKYVVARDALLPSVDPPDVPIEKPAKGPAKEDPLKSCVRDLLNQGGRSEDEARKWCEDYLAMRPDTDESTAADSANIREAERILIQTREDVMKPRELEQCTRNRMALFGEGEFTAGKNCRRDWELGERVRGSPEDYPRLEGPLGNVRAVATDEIESRLSILDQPASFQQLARLRIQLDNRTEELMETSNMLDSVSGSAPRKYTFKEADRKARQELGLPQVSRMQPDVATVPDVTGETRAQRIQQSQAVNADKRPGERMISPESGVPNLYGKSREQVVKEVFEQHAEDNKS
jgi:hypothetical protein